jgi:hypothetical protein
VQSSLGEGATFRLTIPVQLPDNADAPVATEDGGDAA